MFIKTNKETLFRDMSSKAISIKDDAGRADFFRRKEENERMNGEINKLREDILELKQLISSLNIKVN